MNYELLYLVGSSKEPELDKIKKEASDIVVSEGGVFEEKQVVEKRKMAYKIGSETHGFYVAQRFELESPEKIRLITKRLNLNPHILRVIISRSSELPELTSREERKEKSANAPKRERLVEIKKPEMKKAPEAKPEPKEEKPEQPQTAEEIDKKLEEILNI